MENRHEIIKKIEKEEWTKALDKAFEKKVKKVKVDGFREGKCPRNIFEKKFGVESLYSIFGDFWTKLLFGDAYLFSFARSVITYCLVSSLWGFLTFIVEHKRIKNISLGLKILSALCWPLFLAIQFIIDIQAVLSRNLGWKPIPHKDDTRIHNLK